MKIRKHIALLIVLTGVIGVSAWLQFVVSHKFERGANDTVIQNDQPDYHIENFVSIGIGQDGEKYQLSADRLVHYPQKNSAILERPHIIQYNSQGAPRHIYADSGSLYQDDSTVLLYGNVKVIENQPGLNAQNARAVTTTNEMLIHLHGE